MFNVFGVDYHLYLIPYTQLISPACITQRIGSNKTNILEPCTQGEELCHYHGYIKDENQSSAAISTCGGLHGIISLADHDLVIQPVHENHLNITSLPSHPHVIYRRSVRKSSCKEITGQQISDDLDEGNNYIHKRSERQKYPLLHRRKRSAGQYIEIKAVVAPDAAKFHGADTRKFVTTVLNIAAQRFQDTSLGYKLFLTLVEILILEEDKSSLPIDKDSNTLLKNFCQWQKQYHPIDDSNPRHADHVLLITSTDLEDNGDDSNVGLSYKGAICSKDNGCSVNEDTGLDLGLTIAHELGHSLGMSHDGLVGCRDNVYIMSTNGAGGLKWSKCSAKSLEDLMSSSTQSSCLNDAPASTATNLHNIGEKPGMLYSANKQCQLALSFKESAYCYSQVDCHTLKCLNRNKECVSYSSPLVDGTECGNRKWCLDGQCVAMGSGSPGPIKGGWSSWSNEWTVCSRTCGGGVKTRTRKCNNPEPRYGGRDCQGEGIMAMLCNVQTCQTSQYKLKEEQCAATDSVSYKHHMYHWLPYASSSADHACQLLCRYAGGHIAVPRGSTIYQDGTECEGQSELGRCINGKCEEFGCDGHHKSGLQFDKCGVCNGGGNTCQGHRGHYKEGIANKYVTFVTVPKGATGIVITNLNQFCHLSVQVNGKRLFSKNGNSQSSSGTYSGSGVVAKYRRQGPEKIEINGPLPANVEAQVWRDYGSDYVGTSPDVTYTYHTPSGGSQSAYKWVKTPGSCSQTCGHGHSIPVVNCVQVNSNQPTDDFHCNLFSKPSESPEACNGNPCPPGWSAGNWESCSRTCGGGITHRTVHCAVLQHGSHTPVAESHCRGQKKPQTSKSCNITPCPGVWKAADWSCCSKTCSKGVKTRQVKCYASHDSSQPIEDSNCVADQKPGEQEMCMAKPCDSSLSGSSCTDKLADCPDYKSYVCTDKSYDGWSNTNCKEFCGYCVKDPDNFKPPPSENCKDSADCSAYGDDVCTTYAEWSKHNCQKTCNLCPVEVCSDTNSVAAPATTVSRSTCTDVITDCADYGDDVCTAYGPWAKKNCQKHCNFCKETQALHTTSAQSTEACADKISDCAEYGADVCTAYGEWAKTNCQKHCGFCQETCKDKLTDCADYGKSSCTDYGDWAKENCQNFCGFCGARKKRSVLPTREDEPIPIAIQGGSWLKQDERVEHNTHYLDKTQRVQKQPAAEDSKTPIKNARGQENDRNLSEKSNSLELAYQIPTKIVPDKEHMSQGMVTSSILIPVKSPAKKTLPKSREHLSVPQKSFIRKEEPISFDKPDKYQEKQDIGMIEDELKPYIVSHKSLTGNGNTKTVGTGNTAELESTQENNRQIGHSDYEQQMKNFVVKYSTQLDQNDKLKMQESDVTKSKSENTRIFSEGSQMVTNKALILDDHMEYEVPNTNHKHELYRTSTPDILYAKSSEISTIEPSVEEQRIERGHHWKKIPVTPLQIEVENEAGNNSDEFDKELQVLTKLDTNQPIKNM
ncbi:A disintegrin and metalloproteinase with thrombospondin motifs 12-like [Mytilus californianus]|uniref:A disintegrin and metalloproteinase with thrombospondin motifs 12-like n=1 Tax=Mytilus californianus TaxID=6549 RepID=UPI00224655DD|nr:A disintegrin and metalloproteinase with thrombospondin motifs 12-like [Mytilus californianus]